MQHKKDNYPPQEAESDLDDESPQDTELPNSGKLGNRHIWREKPKIK